MASAPLTVLLTGFEPFAGADSNPSWDAVERVAAGWSDQSARVVAELLPVEFTRSLDALDSAIARHSPDIVISVGLAENRDAITPERIGINVDDARIPDNGGDQPVDRPIELDGPAGRFSTLPIRAITGAIAAAGIPAKLSDSAGTYVCNHVLYALQAKTGLRASGFIHVPLASTIPLEQITEAIHIATEVTVAAVRGHAMSASLSTVST